MINKKTVQKQLWRNVTRKRKNPESQLNKDTQDLDKELI